MSDFEKRPDTTPPTGLHELLSSKDPQSWVIIPESASLLIGEKLDKGIIKGKLLLDKLGVPLSSVPHREASTDSTDSTESTEAIVGSVLNKLSQAQLLLMTVNNESTVYSEVDPENTSAVNELLHQAEQLLLNARDAIKHDRRVGRGSPVGELLEDLSSELLQARVLVLSYNIGLMANTSPKV